MKLTPSYSDESTPNPGERGPPAGQAPAAEGGFPPPLPDPKVDPDLCLRHLVKWYSKRLVLAVKCLLPSGSKTSAEDICQEAFLKAWQGIKACDPTRDPWPWLVTIARNAVYDAGKTSESQRQRRTVEGYDLATVAGRGSRETDSANPDLLASVEEILSELPDRDQHIIRMWASNPENYTQLLVTELRMTSGAIRTQRNRVFERIQRALLKRGIEVQGAHPATSDLPAGGAKQEAES